MAKRKARTSEEKERDKDKRIQRKFGITLANRDQRIREQDGKCKICGGPLDAYGPPNIDHYHFFVEAARHFETPLMIEDGWDSVAFDERGSAIFKAHAQTKAAAIAAVKILAMPWSIRGMLCFKCNKGLGYIARFFGAERNPHILLFVFNYLLARLKSA